MCCSQTIDLISHPARSGFLFVLSEYGRTTGVASRVLPQPPRFFPRYIFPELDNSLFGRRKPNSPKRAEGSKKNDAASSSHDDRSDPSAASSVSFGSSLSSHDHEEPPRRVEGGGEASTSSASCGSSGRRNEEEEKGQAHCERSTSQSELFGGSGTSTSTSKRKDAEEEEERSSQTSGSLCENLDHLVFACPQSGIADWTWKPVAGALVSFEQFDDREISFVFCHAALPPDARHQLVS